MTWVIGLHGPAYVSLLSDIQISWQDGGNRRCADVLQKSFFISPNLVMGFAGSVRLGFEAVRLARLIHPSADVHVDIDSFIDRLRQELIRSVTNEDIVREGGLRVIVAGVRADKNVHIGLSSCLAVLDGSSSFSITHAKIRSVAGIGSGQSYYPATFAKLNDGKTLWSSQGGDAPEPAIQFAYQTYASVASQPLPTVSRHMHFNFIAKHEYGVESRHMSLDPPLWVLEHPDAIGLLTSSWNDPRPWAGGNDLMPPTASSLDELKPLLHAQGFDARYTATLHTEESGALAPVSY